MSYERSAGDQRVDVPTDGKSSSRGIVARVRGLLALSLLQNHYPALHGLRVVAIVLVVQLHFTLQFLQVRGLDSQLIGMSMGVWYGMDMFFILSGFLIGTILFHGMHSASRSGFARFYLRRAFRILPLYYVVLIVLAILVSQARELKGFWRELVYLTNYPYSIEYVMPWSWSLSVEEHFYLFVPLIVLLVTRVSTHRARIALLLLLWASGLASRLAVFFSREEPWDFPSYFTEIYTPTHVRYDILIAGVLLAYVNYHFKDRLRALFEKPVIRRAAVGVSLLLLFVVFNGQGTKAPAAMFREEFFLHCFYIGTFTSVAYFLLILWSLYTRSWILDFLSHRIMLVWATLGYGIYLVHIAVIHVLVTPLLRYLGDGLPTYIVWPGGLAASLVGSFAIAYGLHVLVEKPALYFRDRVAP